MGMYTEIFVNADLREDTPAGVIEILQAMCEMDHDAECLRGKPHRWATLFGNASFYVPNTQVAALTQSQFSKRHSFLGKGDIKNYESEIEQFFEFIKPWCEDDFIGYHRYEENREPTLVFK